MVDDVTGLTYWCNFETQETSVTNPEQDDEASVIPIPGHGGSALGQTPVYDGSNSPGYEYYDQADPGFYSPVVASTPPSEPVSPIQASSSQRNAQQGVQDGYHPQEQRTLFAVERAVAAAFDSQQSSAEPLQSKSHSDSSVTEIEKLQKEVQRLREEKRDSEVGIYISCSCQKTEPNAYAHLQDLINRLRRKIKEKDTEIINLLRKVERESLHVSPATRSLSLCRRLRARARSI